MKKPLKYGASYFMNKQQITFNPKNEKERTLFYRIMETNNPEYFIKFYHHDSPQMNYALQESSIKAVNKLNRLGVRTCKIFDVASGNSAYHLSMLVKSYNQNWKDLISFSIFSTYFDILKFIYQICFSIKKICEDGVTLMHLGESQVVQDFDGNYILNNFDFVIENLSQKGKKSKFLSVFFDSFDSANSYLIAPEIKKNKQFGEKALIWDLGVLLHEIFTGKLPSKKLNDNLLDLHLELGIMSNPINKAIRTLIENCLQFDENGRFACDELLDQVTGLINGQMFQPIKNIKLNILKRSMKQEYEHIEESIGDFKQLIEYGKFKDEKKLNLFKPNKYQPTKTITFDQERRILMSPFEEMNDKFMRNLIDDAWNNPHKIYKFYDDLLNNSSRIMSDSAQSMRVLIVLNNLLFNGPRETITTKNLSNVSPLNIFLETFLLNFSNNKEGIIFRYSLLLLTKMQLHNKLQYYLDNNFSISKANYETKYLSVLSPGNIISIIFYMNFIHYLLVSDKKFWMDYYYKSWLIQIFEELNGALGSLSNILSFLIFTVSVHEQDLSKTPLTKENISLINNQIDQIILLIDRMTHYMNILILQCSVNGWQELKLYRFQQDILNSFNNLKSKIKSRVKNTSKATPQYFLKFFTNAVLRQKDCRSGEDFVPQKDLVKDSKEFKVKTVELLRGYLNAGTEFLRINQDILDTLGQANAWFLDNKDELSSFSTISVTKLKTVPSMTSIYGKSTSNKNNSIKRQFALTSMANVYIPRNRTPQQSRKTSPKVKKTSKKQKKNISTQTEYDVSIFFPHLEKLEYTPLKGIIDKRNQFDLRKEKIEEVSDKEMNEGKLDYKYNSQGEIILYDENINEFLKEQVYELSSEWIINFEDLKFEEMIATGSTCNVYKGTFKNIPVAIKKLKSVNPSAKFKYMKEFKREVGLLLSMPKHPNMVYLYGFCEVKNEIFLVFEYCEGNTLFDILYRRDTKLKLNLQQKLKILMDICRGMQFLHEMSPQMIHRDLKTLNILLDVPIEKDSLNFTAKLADFGLTRVYEANTEFLTKRMGTFHWMAPEVFANKPYSTKSDIYGFAIMMWEVFSEKTPYYHLDDASEVIRFVFYKGGRPKVSDCKIQKRYVNHLTNLMKRNWEEEPENRQEFKDLYNSLNKLFVEL